MKNIAEKRVRTWFNGFMTFWQAIILGLIQGVTEFLPVSSSGHLFLTEKYLGINDGSLSFEIALHLATLLAVLIFFWSKIKQITIKELWLLALGTLALGPVTLLTKNWLKLASQSSLAIGLALIITALINFLSYKELKKDNQHQSVDSELKALKIGFWQSLAVFPGVSRSGMTLFASLKNKVKTEEAFNFTFLLSIPAILAAAVYDLIASAGIFFIETDPPIVIAGLLTAFISALLSLKLLKSVINHNRFLSFALYCLVLGSLQIILALV